MIHPEVWSDSDTGLPICTKYPNLQVPAEYEYCRQPGLDAQAELHSVVDECAGESTGWMTSAKLSHEALVGAWCRLDMMWSRSVE